MKTDRKERHLLEPTEKDEAMERSVIGGQDLWMLVNPDRWVL